MKGKILLIGIVLATLLIGSVIAEEIVTPQATDFSLTSWLKHTFGISQFSIVGTRQSCGKADGTPTFSFDLYKEQVYQGYASETCPSKHGMWDVFVNGNPWMEFKDDVNVRCKADVCQFEMYCCPKLEPATTKNCQDWYGDYSELKTASCSLWKPASTNGINWYKCTTIYGTEKNIPYGGTSFKYCTQNNGFDCYYYSGSGTTCTKINYPESYISCPTVNSYQGQLLYSSEPICESHIPSGKGCTPSCDNKCGGVSDGCGGTCDASCENEIPQKLAGVIYDISYPTKVNPKDDVTIKFKVKNNGDGGVYLLEAGLIPKQVAKNWGYSYSGGSFSVLNWLSQVNTECCKSQPNIFAKTVPFTWVYGDIQDVELKFKAPYNGMADLCYNNTYWDGEGEYVLYIVMKTGCYPEGEDVTYETKIIQVGEIKKNETNVCVNNEAIFYTNIKGTYTAGAIVGKITNQLTIEDANKLNLNPYFENKKTACCENLTYQYLENKEVKSDVEILLGLLGKVTIDGSVDRYKCISKTTTGFCLEFADSWLNPITKTDDCQTNTIFFLILIVFGFIIIARLASR